MQTNLSVSTHRLKYKDRFLTVSLHKDTKGALLGIDFAGSLTNFEKVSAKKICAAVNHLLGSGIDSRIYIISSIRRLPDVDPDILDFFKNLITSNYLPLK